MRGRLLLFAAAVDTIPVPLAGVDAEAFPPGFVFNQSLLAPLAGVDAVAYPGVIYRNQTLLAALAESGAWVFPASITDPAAPTPAGMVVKSYSRAGALLATLSLGTEKAWTDQVDDTGSGSVTVQNDDPDYAHTGFDRILRFELDGQPQFASLVETRDVTSLAPNGGAGEVTRLGGRGTLAVLDEWTIPPSRGDGSLPIEEVRSFSWLAPDFSDAGWPLAKKIMPVTAPDLFFAAVWPEPWPDRSAWWIWADRDDCSASAAPPGFCLFRQTLTVAAETRVAVFAGFDNRGEVFVDGAQVIKSSDDWSSLTGSRRVEVTLSAGTHVIAARAENFDHGFGSLNNPGRFTCAVYSVDTAGLLDTLLLHTDHTWKCLPYPVAEPGFTNGQVLRILLEEAQAENACMGVTLGFTDTLDSNGNPWPVESEITVSVNRSFLELVQELAGSTADVAMAPGAMVLRAWRFGERGTTKAVTLTAGSDLAGLSHAGKRTTANAVRVRWAGGWLREEDAASIAANGRHQVSLDLGNIQSEEKARELARQEMGRRSSPRYATSADVDPATTLEQAALNGLEPGDTITHPNETLAPEQSRIRAITVRETQYGRVDRSYKLNDIAEELESRFDRWLRRIGPGVLAGGSRIAAPGGQPQPSDRQVSAVQVAEYSYEGTVNTSSTVRLLLNGAYVGPVVSFTSGDKQVVSLDVEKIIGNAHYLQVEVDGVLSQKRTAEASGNLIAFEVTRTAAGDGTAGIDAKAMVI